MLRCSLVGEKAVREREKSDKDGQSYGEVCLPDGSGQWWNRCGVDAPPLCLVGRTGSLKTPEGPDEPDRRGTSDASRTTYRERFPHVFDRDLAPCA